MTPDPTSTAARATDDIDDHLSIATESAMDFDVSSDLYAVVNDVSRWNGELFTTVYGALYETIEEQTR